MVRGLLLSGNVKAELVEINNCMRVSPYGDVYDPLTEKIYHLMNFYILKILMTLLI